MSKEMTREQWKSQREEAWRSAWIELITIMPADALNGIFIEISRGTGSVLPALFPLYELEELAACDEEKELVSAKDFREAWSSFAKKQKMKLLDDGQYGERVYTKTIEKLDDMFTMIIDNDEKFEDDEEG